MKAPDTPDSSLADFVTYCRSIHAHDGDAELRATLSAHRDVVRHDPQIGPESRARLLTMYDQVESTLLPTSAPPSPPNARPRSDNETRVRQTMARYGYPETKAGYVAALFVPLWPEFPLDGDVEMEVPEDLPGPMPTKVQDLIF